MKNKTTDKHHFYYKSPEPVRDNVPGHGHCLRLSPMSAHRVLCLRLRVLSDWAHAGRRLALGDAGPRLITLLMTIIESHHHQVWVSGTMLMRQMKYTLAVKTNTTPVKKFYFKNLFEYLFALHRIILHYFIYSLTTSDGPGTIRLRKGFKKKK